MSAPAERIGEPEACPSCGLTTIVHEPVKPPAEDPAEFKQHVRRWWTSNKWLIIIASSIVTTGLLVIFLIVAFSAPDGLFPPRSEVAKLLRNMGITRTKLKA